MKFKLISTSNRRVSDYIESHIPFSNIENNTTYIIQEPTFSSIKTIKSDESISSVSSSYDDLHKLLDRIPIGNSTLDKIKKPLTRLIRIKSKDELKEMLEVKKNGETVTEREPKLINFIEQLETNKNNSKYSSQVIF